jgi:hypothetical protein
MDVIKTLQGIFREPDEEELVQKLISENEFLRKQMKVNHTLYSEEETELFRQKANAILNDVTCALVIWDRAAGEVSADYTLVMLKQALEETAKKFYSTNKDRMFQGQGELLDKKIAQAVEMSKAYDIYLKNKGRK